MSKKIYKGDGTHTPVINLKLNDEGCLLNCFGMQPIFYERISGLSSIPFVDIFCVDRVQNKHVPTGRTRIHARVTTENFDIFPKSFDLSQSDQKVVNVLFEYSDHFQLPKKIDEYSKKELKENVLYQALFVRYRTTMNKANFFISSNEELLNKLNFRFTELNRYERYLVDKSVLPDNVLMLGSREINTFANPICACPLIEKEHFDEFLRSNDVYELYYSRECENGKNFPIIEHYLTKYEILQQYIDEYTPQRWYVHRFDSARVKAPYITIHFKE